MKRQRYNNRKPQVCCARARARRLIIIWFGRYGRYDGKSNKKQKDTQKQAWRRSDEEEENRE